MVGFASKSSTMRLPTPACCRGASPSLYLFAPKSSLARPGPDVPDWTDRTDRAGTGPDQTVRHLPIKSEGGGGGKVYGTGTPRNRFTIIGFTPSRPGINWNPTPFLRSKMHYPCIRMDGGVGPGGCQTLLCSTRGGLAASQGIGRPGRGLAGPDSSRAGDWPAGPRISRAGDRPGIGRAGD